MVANDTVPLALRAAAAREPLPPGSLLALLAGYRVGRYAVEVLPYYRGIGPCAPGQRRGGPPSGAEAA